MQPAILLVAEASATRDMLHRTLTAAGYLVTEVADGIEALDRLRLNLTRKRPHRLVVLLNQTSPHEHGADLLRDMANDAHLAAHHTYVLLAPAAGPAFHVDAQAFPNLTITELPHPCPPEVVCAVVARAASQLGMGSQEAGRRD
jgi:CheY-like chemotaxis protein